MTGASASSKQFLSLSLSRIKIRLGTIYFSLRDFHNFSLPAIRIFSTQISRATSFSYLRYFFERVILVPRRFRHNPIYKSFYLILYEIIFQIVILCLLHKKSSRYLLFLLF